MIDKHFSTRHNKCRWNVCFIFSLREIKYDEHKVKSCYLLPLIRRRIETNNMKLMIVTVIQNQKSMLNSICIGTRLGSLQYIQ